MTDSISSSASGLATSSTSEMSQFGPVTRWLSFAVWIFGTACFPIGILFDSQIAYLRYHWNLDNIVSSVFEPIPVWILVIMIPATAVIASFFLSGNKLTRLIFASVPFAIMALILGVFLLSNLVFSGWPI